jgi:hypothetical protein
MLKVERGGILRVNAAGDWEILQTPTHQSDGLTGVTVVSGRLVVAMAPVEKVLTAAVNPDEAYAGRFAAGPSVGLDKLVITIRDTATHALVDAGSTSLRLSSSNWFVWVQGWITEPAPSI